jgi:glutamyl-tRNA synthetase
VHLLRSCNFGLPKIALENVFMPITPILSPTLSRALAEIIIPEWSRLLSIKDLEEMYPYRVLPAKAMVTRVSPSPTGFMHLGGLYVGLINYLLAKISGGVFFLRVEDTDTARYVKGALDTIVDVFPAFNFACHEGLTRSPDNTILTCGSYGPYIQSERKDIYRAVLFELICQGIAYPCFMTAEELDATRKEQSVQNVRPGIYGQYARYRTLDIADAMVRITHGEKYVVRFRAPTSSSETISWNDAARGSMSAPVNDADAILLKSEGMPSYHFAHLVDDHFMRTTHVIRADEWLPSMPLHLQLFHSIGWKSPIYGHLAPIQKMEGSSRRKLSKRKDPEADIRYYLKQGYAPEAIAEYLLTLANSTFEKWRNTHPDVEWQSFPLCLDRLNNSGALADSAKLNNISRHFYARIAISELIARVINWVREYPSPLGELLVNDLSYTTRVLEIDNKEGHGAKRFASLAELAENARPFFDEFEPPLETLPYPTRIALADRLAILDHIARDFDDTINADEVFTHIKKIATELNYASSVKEFNTDPTKFKGHVGDVAMVIRLALFGSPISPDLGLAMTTLGSHRVVARCRKAIRMTASDKNS